MHYLLGAIVLYLTGQTLIWFQTNGQFIWPWFKENPLIVSIVGGTIISYTFILGTRMAFEYFDGQLWPGRFLGFSMGISSFAFLTWAFFGEAINLKTAICLVLATSIICIQLFWK